MEAGAGAIVLAVLLTLSTALHDGLEAFKAQRWEEAITKLTLVIDKDVPGNDFREVARFYRAQSYAAKGDKEHARQDLFALVRVKDDAAFITPSVAFYKKWGGDPDLLPIPHSAGRAWEDLLKRCQAGDLTAARELTVDALSEAFEAEDFKVAQAHAFYNSHHKLVPKKITVTPPNVADGADPNGPWQAVLVLTTADGKGPEVTVDLQRLGDAETGVAWMISSVSDLDAPPAEAHEEAAQVVVNDVAVQVDQHNMQQLVMGLRGFNGRVVINGNGVVQGGAAAVAPVAAVLTSPDGQPVKQWKHPKTGDTKPYAYRRPFPQPADAATVQRTLIGAAPVAVDGQREVMYWGGRTGTMPEAEFQKFALTVPWQAPGPLQAADIPADTRAEVDKLVKQLGAEDPTARRTAKARLKELGPAAFPQLQAQRDHADPEVRMTVRELLGE